MRRLRKVQVHALGSDRVLGYLAVGHRPGRCISILGNFGFGLRDLGSLDS